jgi:adenylate cyclase
VPEHRRLAAIVALDLAGYSRLIGLDESGTLASLKARRRDLIDPQVGAHGGRIVKTMGDGLLLEFPSVVEAVRCAVAIQEGMPGLNAGVPADRQLAFRVGVHVGDIVVDGDDIFGDGVNIAARLEGIAAPGGICLSDRAHDEVRDRLTVAFADGGERKLKNIARPIHVWHWPAGGAALVPPPPATLAVPDRPSIAVLPFDNMTSDPDQDYFADGIAEDLITALSRFRELFVIARNSTFVFKGTPIDIKEVGRRLGVRYVVEGSLRRTGNRVRVTAQLIEAATGRHVWAERYDRDLDDVFAAQDEVTEAIVAAIAPAVTHLERERVREARCSCSNMGAWENYQRGLWHVYRYSQQDIAMAKELFACAIRTDAQFAPAYAGEAYALFVEAIWGFVADAGANLRKARQSAQRAVTLDARDAFAHLVLGRVLMTSGEVRAALTECRIALELNPNLAAAHFGLAYGLAFAGRIDEALDSVDRAIRLSPYDPLMHAFVTLKSGMLVLAGRYDEALETARDAQRKPNCTAWASLHEATALANLGRLDEAKAAMDKAYALQPDISMRWVRTLLPAEPGVAVDAYFEGMKKAGLKD